MSIRQARQSTLFICSLSFFAMVFLFVAASVSAIDYPKRDIRVIVPYKPGGGSERGAAKTGCNRN